MSETILNIEKKEKLVPDLRFNEFDNSWSKVLLGNVASKVGSGSTPTGGVQVYQTLGIPFIRSQNVYDNKLVLDETHISGEIHEKMKGSTVQSNDILLNITGGSIGRSCVVPNDFEEGNVNQHVCIIRLKSDYTPGFLQPFLSSHKGQKLIFQGQTGSGREGINFQSIRLFKLNLPTLPEQQKIASFLSAVDQKIQQLTRKKELLEQYKKGVMQQLFSGKLRFRDQNGEEFPEWEEKTLQEVSSFRRGSFPQPYGLPKWYDDNGAPFVQVYDVAENMLLKPKTKQYISSAAQKQSVFVKKGTLVLTIQGSIGRLAKTQYDAYVDRTLLIFQSYKVDMDIDYFKYVVFLLFEIEKIRAPGGTIKTITKEKLSSFNVNIPCIEEQQKIAAYLSGIDTKIDHVNHQITQTQLFKKGLLQQMFV